MFDQCVIFLWLMAILNTEVDLESKVDDEPDHPDMLHTFTFFYIIFIITIIIFSVLPFTFLFREVSWKTIRCQSTRYLVRQLCFQMSMQKSWHVRSALWKKTSPFHISSSPAATYCISTGVSSSKYLHGKNTYMAWTHEAQVRKTFIIHEAIFNIKQEK